MAPTAVDRFYDECRSAIAVLAESQAVSARVAAADNFRKSLLLAAASYFEHTICKCVLEFVREHSAGSPLVAAFVQNRAIARQYHTWFKWDDTNANQFFGLFGAEFKATMKDRVAHSGDLSKGIRAFLELGNERNRLVHNDFATFQFEKTLDEVYALYVDARQFVDDLPVALRSLSADAESA